MLVLMLVLRMLVAWDAVANFSVRSSSVVLFVLSRSFGVAFAQLAVLAH